MPIVVVLRKFFYMYNYYKFLHADMPFSYKVVNITI